MTGTKCTASALAIMFLLWALPSGFSQQVIISGYIKTPNQTPVMGVRMAGLPGEPVTDSYGFYKAYITSTPWSARVTPTNSCYTFSPAYTDYAKIMTNQTTNYQATVLTNTISGYVLRADKTPLIGATLEGFPNGQAVHTDAKGYYYGTVPCSWSGTITPWASCHKFNPVSTTYSNVTSNQSTYYTATETKYKISGNVRDANLNAIADVTMIGLGVTNWARTDSIGHYEASMCHDTGNLLVEPSKACYSFSPSSRNYPTLPGDMPKQDYTGTLLTYTISGFIKDGSNVPMPGISLTVLPDNRSVITGSDGSFSVVVPCGWSGTITPRTPSCYTLTPSSYQFPAVAANISNINFAAAKLKYTVTIVAVAGTQKVPVPGVTLMDFPGNPVTDATGTASASVDCGWSGTVKPQKECYLFSNIVVPAVNSNLSLQVPGVLLTPSIQGRVIDASTGAGIDGVTMSGFPGTAVVTANGGYYSTTVDCKWSGTVTPVKSCISFNPPSYTHGPVLGSAIQNYTGATRQTVRVSGKTIYAGSLLEPNPLMLGNVTLEGFPASLNPLGVQSNSAGYYEAIVACGWSGSITARKECYVPSTFLIPTVTSDTTQNFNLYTSGIYIRGYVRGADGRGIQGVKINGITSNGQPVSVVTGADGSCNSGRLNCPWNGQISAELACYSFSPIWAGYSDAKSDIDLSFTGSRGFTISGFLKDATGTSVSGIEMTGLPGNPVTDRIGFYSAKITPEMGCPWTGTVKPTSQCYSVSPPEYIFNAISLPTVKDFMAAVKTFSISGVITDSVTGRGIPDVVLQNLPGNPKTGADGRYSATVSCNWPGSSSTTVTPVKAGYVFTPASRPYANVTNNFPNDDYKGSAATFTISGRVTNAATGTGMPGVNMSGLATTDSSGYYKTTVAYGWSGSIAPVVTFWNFSPPSRSYTNVTQDFANQDFAGTEGKLTISGTILTADNRPVEGVLLTGLPGDPKTGADGKYSVSVNLNWTGMAVPQKSCYSFNPPSATYTALTSNQNSNYIGTLLTYTVSGRVTNSSGAGIPDVVLQGLPGDPKTTADGLYSAVVPCAWSNTVYPIKTGYSFSPASKTYDPVMSNQQTNYIGVPGAITISGIVKTVSAAAIANVLMTGLEGSPKTNGEGFYSASVTAGWSGTVTPVLQCYSFAPASTPYSNISISQTTNYTGTPGTATISGYIKTAAGTPIAGVTMRGFPGDPKTNDTGFYAVTVACGWIGTVTPAKDCYSFNPPSFSFTDVLSNKSGDFTGTLASYTISGRVTEANGGAAISDVAMGGFPTAVKTDATGSYSTNVSCGWSGTVTPTKSGYTFAPLSTTYPSVTSNQSTDYIGSTASYTISGYVKTASGTGIAGVLMSGLPGNPSTDSGGYYSATVSGGWSGTVTPTKTGYVFDPASRTYSNIASNQTSDYTGAPGTLTISGYVRTANGAGVAAVTMNGLPGNPATDSTGFYSAAVAFGWTGTVTPTKACYNFNPSSSTYSNINSGQTTNYRAALTTFIISGYIRTSNQTPVAGITLTGLPNNPVTDNTGSYSATVTCGWSGSVVPSKSGYTFDPLSASYNSIAANSSTDYLAIPPTHISRDLVIGLHSGAEGWIEIRGDEGEAFSHKAWVQVSWPEYNAAVGETHVASGDIDGDGKRELVVGLGMGGGGYLEIIDDADAGYAHKAWIQVDWSGYNVSGGLTSPAIGDINGDGKNEIIIGLGAGSQGYVEILGDASTGYAHKAWIQLGWPEYNLNNGATSPIIGDIDGDGKNEIILGLGIGGGGYLEVIGDASTGHAHKAWVLLSWSEYNLTNGSTFPAIGDLDNDGKNELIVGLGSGGAGYLEIIGDASAGYANKGWIQIPWIEYCIIGESHPACLDIDGDGQKELVIGLGAGSMGYIQIRGNASSGYANRAWIQLPFAVYNQRNGETTPSP